jgi:O-antigen biosynthesis protein
MTPTEWYNKYQPNPVDVLLIRKHIARLPKRPLLSLLTPVYNTEEKWLRACLNSVLAQLYPNWELCLCDNASNPETSKILHEYAAKDSRIKIVRLEVNQGGYGGTNTALDIATGEFIGFLDSDDELSVHALYLIAQKLNECPETTWIYTDECIVNDAGYAAPFFKPDFAPDLFLSEFFMSHLSMYKSEIIKKLRLRESAGSHDYDLALRVSEIVPINTIKHIPVLAYKYIAHSKSLSHNTESFCILGAMKAVQEHLDRIGRKGRVLCDWPHYRVKYEMESYPHVDICIASINKKGILEPCILDLLAKTLYPNFTILLCVDKSVREVITKRFGGFIAIGKIKFAERPESDIFNYSILANSLSRTAEGPILCFYNDDMEPINHTWLDEMVSLAVHPETGAVGARLVYPNGTLQHNGCVLGLEETAAHVFKRQSRDATGYYGRAKLIGNYSMVTGACLAIRKEVYEQVGGYDENFCVAYGDVDFCLKLVKAGYYNAWTPYANLFHLEAFSRGMNDTPEKQKLYYIETEMLKAKWGSLLKNDPMYNPNLSLLSDSFQLPGNLDEIRYEKPWLK